MRGVHETKRAAAIDRLGGPEVLTLHTLAVPEVDAGELLIALHSGASAAGTRRCGPDGWEKSS
jgi:hypothetical protein